MSIKAPDPAFPQIRTFLTASTGALSLLATYIVKYLDYLPLHTWNVALF